MRLQRLPGADNEALGQVFSGLREQVVRWFTETTVAVKALGPGGEVDVPGLEAIDSIAIYDEDRRIMVDSVRLHSNELPYVVDVRVIERVRQEMV